MKTVEVITVLAGLAGIYTAWRAFEQEKEERAAAAIQFNMDGTTARISGGDPWGIWGDDVGK